MKGRSISAPNLPGSFWPTAQQELLLRTAFLPSAAALDAWREVRETLDFERLDEGSLPLIPVVHRALCEHGVTDALMPRFQGVVRQAWARSSLLGARTGEVTATLSAAGVGSLLTGGLAVAIRHYGSLASRPTIHSDVLVRPGDAVQALAALRRAGLGPSPAEDDRFRAGEPLLLPWRNITVVLRTTLGRDLTRRDSIDLDDLWESAVDISLGQMTPTPCSEAALVIAGLSGARPTSRAQALWVADVATIVRSAPRGVDWGSVCALAQVRGRGPRLADALEYVDSLLGIGVPGEVIRDLRRSATSRERLGHVLTSRGGLGETVGDELILSADHWVVPAAARVGGRLVASGARRILGHPDAARFLARSSYRQVSASSDGR